MPRSVLFWVLLTVALTLRVGWVVVSHPADPTQFSYDDERLHWELATNLVTDGALVSEDGRYGARLPGYPLFLALGAWLGAGGVLFCKLLQCIVAVVGVALGYRLVERATSNRIASFVTGALLACDPFNIFFCGLLLTEVCYTALLLAILFGMAQRRQSTWLLPVIGVLCVFVRSAAAPWLLLVWLWWLWDSDGVRRWRNALALFGCLLLSFGPWCARNYFVMGGFAPMGANGGITLYDALGPQADGSSDQSFLRSRPDLLQLSELQRDRQLWNEATQTISEDPGRVWRLAVAKFWRTWSLTPNVQEHQSNAKRAVSATSTIILLVLGLAGVIRGLHAHRRLVLQLLLPIVLFTVVHCIFIGSVRYRIPLHAPLACLAGLALAPRVKRA